MGSHNPSSARPDRAAGTRPQARILVANHDSFACAYLGRIVGRLGISGVSQVSSGAEVLSKLGEGEVQILLLDFDLPDLPGLEILEILRADAAYERLEVIVTTGANQEGVVRRAIALGISDYVIKPYSQRFLEERIGRVLERLRKRGQQEASKPALESTVLVVDDDRNFVDTLTAAFASKHHIVAAESQARVLTAVMKHEPDCILINPRILGDRLEFIVKTARRILKNDDLQIILMATKGDEETNGASGPTWIQSYVPDTIRATLGPHLARSNSAVWLDGLDLDLTAATEQAFGMMARAELHAVERERSVHREIAMTIPVREPSPDQDWALVLECSRRLARTLTAALLEIEQEDVEDDGIGGITEVLNVLAGRIKQRAHDIGRKLEVGLARSVRPGDLRERPLERPLAMVFQWGDLEPFRVSLLSSKSL